MNFNSRKWVAVLATSCLSLSTVLIGQTSTNLNDINSITTAVPFLRINNDTRSGGMGEVGIAISPDAGGAQLNGAKMAFIENDFGINLSFTPWLKSLVDDIYLANLSGYYKIKNVQTIHASFRYFSLGNIQFKDENNQDLGQRRPQELAVDLGYSRKLGKIFSLGLTLRFIYSNIAPGAPSVTSDVIKPGIAGAADISWLVNKTFDDKKNSKMKHEIFAGMNISNLGSKITYTSNAVRDYIPANLGLGIGYSLHLDEKNTVSAYMDVNRLLVPTPVKPADLYVNGVNAAAGIKPEYDKNGNGVADYREQSTISGVFKSFGGAPTSEKMNENQVGVGVEYMYKKMFGVRGGYFYEHPTKGNRQFASVGATVKYSIVALHLSYLIPVTSQRNPLDNTFRFTLNFEFKKGNKKADTQSTPAEAIPKELAPKKMELERNNGN